MKKLGLCDLRARNWDELPGRMPHFTFPAVDVTVGRSSIGSVNAMRCVRLLLFFAGLVASGLVGCSGFDNTKTNYSVQVVDSGSIVADGGSGASGCTPIQGQPIPARLAVMSEDAGTSNGTPVFVDDIFNRLNSNCGGCHVAANQGNYQLTRGTFVTLANQDMVDRMLSDDPTMFMPPPSAGGKPASQRKSDDPVIQLSDLIKKWMAAGKPNEVFYIVPDTSNTADTGAYLLKPKEGNYLTNIGACLPNKSIVATAQAKMDELDTLFAQMAPLPAGQGTLTERIGLPERLNQTDLFTLDTETLARHGVIAYAPTYPLWSDDAGKLRQVRVPRGQSITFDKSTQALNIPANTRFYKTFLKRIVDTDGSARYRKIETRLIVSRPDNQLPDGSLEPTSLFGTYAWNDDETEALLVTDPLRNGEPFNDRLITVVTDEPAAAEVRRSNPTNLTSALRQKHAIRHYAIPGSDRCLDCHMGSPSHSFVLGFTPLQVKRRPIGEGGTIEPTAADELTQLQRLIDYGVITGVDSPDDLLNLEATQGDRKPRNDHELTAQGYMVGNCAHCHNPHGEPSVDNPVLVNVLNFLPGPGPNQGIFQFPLEMMSPRIARGPGGTIPIPYITPSLMDYPVEGSYEFWQPKADAEERWGTFVDKDVEKSTAPPGVPYAGLFAPWRSLIYRNVDTPFAYSDDYALFPHMPKGVPGFDCRLPRIFGDWMVSIPARRKNTKVWEFSVPIGGTCILGGRDLCDTEPQPYEEVRSSDSDYDLAVSDVEARMNMYHEGTMSWVRPTLVGPPLSRYDYCPDTSDIVDPAVLSGGNNVCSPTLVPAPGMVFDSATNQLVSPNIGVPLRPHWVVTDLTDVPGDWYPRRPDWEDVLIKQVFPQLTGTNCADEAARQTVEKRVVTMLQDVKLSSALRGFALNEFASGLWVNKPQCDLSNVPTVSQLTGSAKPKWVDYLKPPPDPDNPVYMELPGAAIFNMVCVNCHGPTADSQGRMADNLMTMTGGSVRVGNLRDGLFGPVGSAAGNRTRVFGQVANQLTITSDDLGARYMAWMGLGGTKAHIPPSILNIVSVTPVHGQSRHSFQSVSAASANMLSTAQELCQNVLPLQGGTPNVPFDLARGSIVYDDSALIATNGDAELWQILCSIDNPPPIRVVSATSWTSATSVSLIIYPRLNIYRPEGYLANTPVGDQYGHVADSLRSDNTMPWCILKPSNPTEVAFAEQYVVNHAVNGVPLPFCPTALLNGRYLMVQDPEGANIVHNDLKDWATRGAINAGLAVFLYLDQVVQHGLKPKPAYDRCEQLNQ